MLTCTIRLLLLALLCWQLCWAAEWNYSDNGMAWVSQFPQFCAGRRQSPIDLGVAHSQRDPDLPEFVFKQSAPAAFTLTVANNGHSVVVTWSQEHSLQMGISSSQMYYTAEQLHWHWGSNDSKGSEHTVGGTQYPAEGHLVFYNSFDYANFSEAASRVGGLAVLGVFYEKSDSDNPLFNILERALGNETVRASGGRLSLSVGSGEVNLLQQLLPSNKAEFYRYYGSLTTPACHETVMWTVFRQTVGISDRQLRLLRALRFSDNSPMVDNFRRAQPLNSRDRPGANRLLFRSFSAAAGVRAAAVLVVAAAAAAGAASV